MYCSQKLGEDFAKFCGLLRTYELYIEKEIRSLSNRIHRLGKYVLQTPKTPALPKNDRRIRLLISLGFEIVMWVLAHGHG